VSDTETPAPATHDLGGAIRFRCTPVDPDDTPPDAFGKRVDAIRQLLAVKGLLLVDEMRRGIEAIPEAEYHALGYYERWLRSISGIMVEKGVIAAEDLRP
jgi:nitrile hydratase